MKTKLDTNINLSANGEIYYDDCADPVQTPNAWRFLSTSGSRLGSWLVAQLIAHNDRVSALGVYRRCREDEHRPMIEKADYRAP